MIKRITEYISRIFIRVNRESKRFKVFISSPVVGLEKERLALIEALKKRYNPEAMELWASSPDLPKNVCLERVRNSDVVILLSGPFYGSIDSSTGKSFTELEYDEADAYKRDVLHFYKIQKKGGKFESSETDDETRRKHLEFYSRIWQFRTLGFLNSKEAVKQVLRALKEHGTIKREREKPFVGAKEYFRDFLRKGCFRHDYLLVGREEPLQALRQFVESDRKVFVLWGRGGLGKSKVLFEFAKLQYKSPKKQWKDVVFLREIFDINQATLNDLPATPCIVILDDAHRYDDLDSLLSIFKGNPAADKIKLIISARPLGKDKINYALYRNIPFDQVQSYELRDLTEDEVKTLVKNILIYKNPRVVEVVTNMTKDCPLATIVACNLINEKHIDPNIIVHKEEFQRIIFDRFLEEIKGKELSDPQTQTILEYIAALSPVMPSNQDFRLMLSKILNVPISEIAKRIASLEEKGLLLRKGRLVKVVPDLLSDYILYNACIDIHGVPTNFVKEIIGEFHGEYLKNILFNVSEVEWRAKLAGQTESLLGDIWAQLKDDFKNASVFSRIRILNEIEKAAVFQPKEILDVIKIALTISPGKVKEEEDLLGIVEWSNDRVIEDLPKILRRVAYNLEYFEQSCNILWDLGKTEKRELNPYPESPLRILTDLAEYGIRKPLIYNKKFLGCVKNWLSKGDAYSYKYSPLDMIVPLLAKEGEDTEFKVDKITMGSFGLNFSAIDELRKEALDILKDHLNSTKPKRIISRALDLLIESLRRPPGLFGRKSTPEEDEYLADERNRILGMIKDAIPRLKSQALNTCIKKDLRWFELHGKPDSFKSTVALTLHEIEENEEYRIYRGLIGNYREYLEERLGWEEMQKKSAEEAKEVAEIILRTFKSAEQLFVSINLILTDISEYNLSSSPHHVLSEIAKLNPKLALDIFELILSNSNMELAKSLSAFIWPLRLSDEYSKELEVLFCKAIEQKEYWPCLNIAHSFSYGINKFRESDYKNIRDLLKLNEEQITKTLMHGLVKIAKENVPVAYEMTALINIELIPDIVEDLCSIFDGRYGAPVESLKEEQIKLFLGRLVRINIFKGQHWHVVQFLKEIGKIFPDLLIDFLLSRLKYSKTEEGSKSYDPLSYSDFDYDFFDLSKIKDGVKYVRMIRDLALDPAGKDTFWLPRLFKIVSNNYSQPALDVLAQWIKSQDGQKLEAVSLLLREAEGEFLFSQYLLVGELIAEAAKVSDDCLRNIKSDLFGIAISGTRSRSHGQPSKEDVQLKEQGEIMSGKFAATHPAHLFYKEISKYAASQIKDELERDQEMEYE